MYSENGPDDADLLDVAGVPISVQSSYELKDILGLHGRQFVEHAYRLLLAREPEEGGLSAYTSRLLDGTSKLQILANMASSKEALELSVKPVGLARSLVAASSVEPAVDWSNCREDFWNRRKFHSRPPAAERSRSRCTLISTRQRWRGRNPLGSHRTCVHALPIRTCLMRNGTGSSTRNWLRTPI